MSIGNFPESLTQAMLVGCNVRRIGRMVGLAKISTCLWVFITGGCSGRGVQWMGVVLYNKLVYNII